MAEESSLTAARVNSPGRARRGPKPLAEGGERHAHYWAPGQSGNPAGRPKKTERQKNFEETCRQLAYENLDVLEDAVQDETAPWKERLAAFQLLAEHGHGKPVDRIAVKQMGDGGADVRQLPKAVLDQRVARLMADSQDLEPVSEQ